MGMRLYLVVLMIGIWLVGCGPAAGQTAARPTSAPPSATGTPIRPMPSSNSTAMSPGTKATPTPWPVEPIAAGCPVTQRQTPVFTPPAPYAPTSPYPELFWYGTNDLWTMLHIDGTWRGLPHHADGYTQKIVWWRHNYDWIEQPQPTLKVTGRRLDGAAPPLDAPDVTNGHHPDVGSFGLVGVGIPTLGCWEITGQMGTTKLSFVVWVAP